MPGRYLTARRRRLAAELRRLRLAAGFTGEQVAERLAPLGRWSASKVSRIETGRVAAHHGDVSDLLDLYGVDGGPLREELVELARQAGKHGWWQSYQDVLPGHITPLLDFETSSSAIRYVQNLLVPGLLQTAEYARALIRSCNPEAGPNQVDRLVDLRLSRQKVLERDDPPRLSVILDEAALRRPVGGAKAMREQLLRLVEHADAARAVVQVIPFGLGEHTGMDMPFTILSFSADYEPDVVYVEQYTTTWYIDDEYDVRLYDSYFNHLRGTALGPWESRALIIRTTEELS
ncbi:MAG TPA: helix-turn-helix transcriptional regulator [Actinocrinis sp.]|uniref:helix-turn-helix domain-containing protein n=1 Tax=Actinocrinis sp. TaxID=1920516 RepID=UPI002DDD11B0|nr:helix-turn-helix transcriptional regulator [Actinocrinis sp.]HEV2342462.1 helix-turn-helix transcriptional regulator [Actinocrinis sp.]